MVLGALVARRLGAALTERTASLGRALAGIQNSLTSWSVPPVAPQLEVAGFGVALPQASVRADEEADTEVEGQGPWLGHGSLQQLLKESIWFAVPKRKKSYSRKRQRQMNPLYQNDGLQSLYPCPKCEKGYMKVRHHLCPCDQEKVNATGVVKVRYGTGTSTSTTAAAPAAAAAPDADTSRSR